MMQGRLIVLEGIDGSGKSTQYRLLCDRLEKEKISFKKIVFPRYDLETSALIRMYLNGEFGKSAYDVGAYAASTFFAGDRYASYMTDWKDFYLSGGLILSDRYTTSNAVHQGAKLPQCELGSFLDWLYDYEFRLLGLPKPDLVLYMDVDIKTALAQLRARQESTNSAGDIHEIDKEYLQNCLTAGDFAAGYLGWRRVRCMEDCKMRDALHIHGEIYKAVAGQ